MYKYIRSVLSVPITPSIIQVQQGTANADSIVVQFPRYTKKNVDLSELTAWLYFGTDGDYWTSDTSSCLSVEVDEDDETLVDVVWVINARQGATAGTFPFQIALKNSSGNICAITGEAKLVVSESNSLVAAEAAIASGSTGYGGLDDEVITFGQMNDVLTDYLAAADEAYTDDNISSVSVVGDYANEATQDDPIGYTLVLSESGTLYLIDEDEPERTISEEVEDGNFVVYNLIPGHIYRYYLVNAKGITSDNGKLMATGKVRMIYVSTYDNCRDLGGWDCDGGTVRYGLLYRSSDPGTLAVAALKKLGVRSEVDFQETDDPSFGSNCTYYRFEMDGNSSYSGFIKLVVDGGSESALKTTVAALRQIMSNAAYGIITDYHCSLGADRTGTLSALLLGLLGVSGVNIDEDHEITALAGSKFWGSTDLTTRKRTRATYYQFRQYISGLSESGTILDGLLYWCARVGIPLDEVNNYREQMIDGSPDSVTFNNTISYTLDGISLDNEDTEVVSCGKYVANATLETTDGMVTGALVTMNGEDVTSDVWDEDGLAITIDKVVGDIVISLVAAVVSYSVSYSLEGCSSSNTSTKVAQNGSYEATLTLDYSDYAYVKSISVVVNGTDVTNDVWDEDALTISIPNVTGNVTITVVAGVDFVNQIPISIDTDGSIYNEVGYKQGTRLNSSGVVVDDSGSAYWTIGYIPCTYGDIIRLANVPFGENSDVNSLCRVALYDSSFTKVDVNNASISSSSSSSYKDFARDEDGNLTQLTCNNSSAAYIRFCVYIGSGQTFEPNEAIITINEEIA